MTITGSFNFFNYLRPKNAVSHQNPANRKSKSCGSLIDPKGSPNSVLASPRTSIVPLDITEPLKQIDHKLNKFFKDLRKESNFKICDIHELIKKQCIASAVEVHEALNKMLRDVRKKFETENPDLAKNIKYTKFFDQLYESKARCGDFISESMNNRGLVSKLRLNGDVADDVYKSLSEVLSAPVKKSDSRSNDAKVFTPIAVEPKLSKQELLVLHGKINQYFVNYFSELKLEMVINADYLKTRNATVFEKALENDDEYFDLITRLKNSLKNELKLDMDNYHSQIQSELGIIFSDKTDLSKLKEKQLLALKNMNTKATEILKNKYQKINSLYITEKAPETIRKIFHKFFTVLNEERKHLKYDAPLFSMITLGYK
jgi:hypothetical protein